MNKIFRMCMAAAIALAAASCATERSPLTYFTDIEEMQAIPVGDYLVKIEPSDELWITVTSVNPEATYPYNLPFSNPAVRNEILGSSQPKQQTFVVDSEGYINFPVLGKIHAAGLTVEQLRDELTALIARDVDDPLVSVDMVNYTINVAGEVARPGKQYVNSQRYSILDALATAGDLTPYGERNNVLLVREENGKRISHRFDLNSAETLSSPYFFLKQNDYIYVEPNNIRKDNTEYNQNNSFKLSVISTVVSSCSVIISLIIALTR